MFLKIIKNSFLIVLLYLLSCESANEPVDIKDIDFNFNYKLAFSSSGDYLSLKLKSEAYYYDSQISLKAGSITICNVELNPDSLRIDSTNKFDFLYLKFIKWDSINNYPSIGTVSKWEIEGNKEIGLSNFSFDFYMPEPILITSPAKDEDVSKKDGAYIRWKGPDTFNDSVQIFYVLEKYRSDPPIVGIFSYITVENTGFHHIRFDSINREGINQLYIQVFEKITDTVFQIDNSEVHIYIESRAKGYYNLIE